MPHSLTPCETRKSEVKSWISTCFFFFSTWSYAGEWIFPLDPNSQIRGGTTKGTSVTLDPSPSPSWGHLQEKGISNYEKDRRAILALEGQFRTSFEFLETIFLESKRPKDLPYRSWATEFVFLVEDRGDFISLQHILVMVFDKDGKVEGPLVVKHWRQDWTWRPDHLWVFQGDSHWKKKALAQGSPGKWKWSIFQVDDSFRYEGVGQWIHYLSISVFETQILPRPLPRREFSVRSDYKVLLGRDSLILTPNSWFHEQRNMKHLLKLGANDETTTSPILSREIGHNSYRRIKGFDFKAGFDYWNKTKPYWRDVRFIWEEIRDSRDEIKLRSSVGGKRLFMHHFENAENSSVLGLPVSQRRAVIRKLLESFIF